MHKSWNKGFTKLTHLSVLKISETMRKKRLDNFSCWRKRMKKEGKLKFVYNPFEKNGDLAELIGVILGDGHIEKFPRTERLYIASNSKNEGFIKRYAKLIEDIFKKAPTCTKMKKANCVRISLYEKFISKRLKIPTGNRKEINFKIPIWIKKNKNHLIRFLRGLYEAEGSFCIHKPTSTYKLFFANKNSSLLDLVYDSLKELGFHPNKSSYKIQVSRKEEVYRSKDLLEFRNYNIK